jgi:methionyl-tRNA formyltransferase
MRVAFAGTPEFAAVALAALLRAGFTMPLVLTQPDRPAGRGLRLQGSAVKALALAHQIPVAQPRGLRLDGRFAEDAAAARDLLQAARPDVMVVAAYGLILPNWVLDLPRHGCVNIHASLLPRWRGAAPIQRAIEAGDRHTGITVMQMDAGLDTGDMLLTESIPIAPNETSASLHERLAPIGGRLVVEALRALADGALVAHRQPVDGVTYAHKIGKAEAHIDWLQPAPTIERRLRAFDPFPGATFAWHGEGVKLWRGAPLPAHPAVLAGQVFEPAPGRVAVGCAEGALELLEVQRPGGRRIPVAQYLASGPGATLRTGVRLDAGG